MALMKSFMAAQHESMESGDAAGSENYTCTTSNPFDVGWFQVWVKSLERYLSGSEASQDNGSATSNRWRRIWQLSWDLIGARRLQKALVVNPSAIHRGLHVPPQTAGTTRRHNPVFSSVAPTRPHGEVRIHRFCLGCRFPIAAEDFSN